MKYAVTDYDGCEYITAGKRYEVIDVGGLGFYIKNDNDQIIYCLIKRCGHIHGNDWRIIEMNNDIEKKGNDFEVKYDGGAKFKPKEIPQSEALEALDWIITECGFSEESTDKLTRNMQTIRAALQKQPETSDVTRSDIELRDWYAKTALQSVVVERSLTPKQIADISNEIADLMMEARK